MSNKKSVPAREQKPLPTEPLFNLSASDKKCWVNWRYETRGGKKTKVPYMPSGSGASSTNSDMWSTYAEVVAAKADFDGIGIILEGSLLGIDLDHCISKEGTVSPQIAALIKAAKTCTEVSPSGEGLHLYLRLTEPLELENKRSGSYECYTTGRYFTVTGNAYSESYPIRSVNSEEAIELLKILGYPWQKKEEVVPAVVVAQSVSLEDAEVLTRMFASKNGAKIHALYDGDISAYEGDDSNADAALCAHLAFWTNNNAAQIMSLWLASPLGAREKTQKRADYQKRTIDNAISLTKETVGNANNAPEFPLFAARTSQRPRAIFSRLSDIQPVPVNWLWHGRIARGKVTLIVGDPGLGKSQVALSLAAIGSKGLPWPVDGGNAPLGDTVLLSAEDDAADTIRPRLDAAGVDPERVIVLQSIKKMGTDGRETEHMFSLKDDLEILADVLATLPAPQLVIIDPISAYLGTTDSHKNSDVRGLLAPLAALASRFGVAVVAISHLNKNSNDKNPIYRAMGSLAFTAAARACYMVVRDKSNVDRRLVLPVKNNLGQDLTGLAFSIASTEDQIPFLVWEQSPVVVPMDEIFSGPDTNEELTDTEWAVQVIKLVLADGPKPYKEVESEIKKAGIKDKAFRRARQKLAVVTSKERVANGAWLLELPGHEGTPEVPSQEGILGEESVDDYVAVDHEDVAADEEEVGA